MRVLTGIFAGILLLSGISALAKAAGVTDYTLGSYRVFCFSEGDRATAFEKITLPEKSAALRTQAGANASGMNFFVVASGNERYLIDAGNAGETTVTLLEQAGIHPGQITHILLTHMHPDHIRGLLSVEGQAVFPNATLHVAREEAAYWSNPAQKGGNFERARQVLAVYGKRLDCFAQNSVIGIAASIPAFGHTPGHTAFRLGGEGKNLVFWGDIVHVPIQFADPEVFLSYDVDAPQAIATRKRLMAQLAQSGDFIVGAHILAPGIGRLEAAGEGYRFVPGLE
ncbi:MAG: MBL fold metallo-hydrolase [Deltaproteobacteria bacterium]|nr:MBL fold metallo-hydrolase [Deltaproteobacteria bacterium]